MITSFFFSKEMLGLMKQQPNQRAIPGNPNVPQQQTKTFYSK
jgi:hypothetical protein